MCSRMLFCFREVMESSIKASEDGPKGLNGNFLIRTRRQIVMEGFLT